MRFTKAIVWLLRRLPSAAQGRVLRQLIIAMRERAILIGPIGCELVWKDRRIWGHEIYGADLALKVDPEADVTSTVFAPLYEPVEYWLSDDVVLTANTHGLGTKISGNIIVNCYGWEDKQ